MEPPDELRAQFPTLDWSRIELRRGLPWYARRGTRAMVVPVLLSRRRGVRVRVREDVDLATPEGRALLAHECYHALQYQEGRASFVLAYLVLALRHGFGRAHPLEAPAYAAAWRREPVARAEPTPRRALRELLRRSPRAAPRRAR